ncbi:MAG: hypothetical protein ACT6RD_15215 [Brevundimonas sp.]|uniref:hypothetical protein n=1 Tax=Brevundimonas sp. TaxID=1871086 RepID=UPI00403445FD
MREDAAARRLAPGLRDPRLIGLTAALLVHVALLGPALWGLVGGETVAIDTDPGVIPLDLSPPAWPGVQARRPTARLPLEAAPREARSTDAARNAAPPADVLGTPTQIAAADGLVVDDAWPVGGAGPGREPWGGDVCRDISNFRAWEAANCRERGPALRAAARGSPPVEVARPEPRRGRAPGEARDEAFAEQAAANEAWRSYTRERDAPYPGLRSLLKHH